MLFLIEFENGNYTPSLLFNETDIIGRIHNHPMPLWKINSSTTPNSMLGIFFVSYL